MSPLYTVLVVDDDPVLLDVVTRILTEPGYTVLTALDGFEAIRTLADRHVDLLIADVKMPGLDGLQLGQQAKVMRPNLHIIYITGLAQSKAPEGSIVMQKPVRAADLIRTIRQKMSA
jgi:CheY-like chemotaxis protein